jgi:chromosome segregation ATPase
MKDFAAIFNDGNTFQAYLLVIATLGSLITPVVAYTLRAKRATRPKTPSETLYAYYENYINLLLTEIAKKDVLIERLSSQTRDQQRVIYNLEKDLRGQKMLLEANQDEIESLRAEVADLQKVGQRANTHLQDLKSYTADASPSSK